MFFIRTQTVSVLTASQTYTIEYGRDGKPSLGLIVGRLKSTGQRFLANQGDEATLSHLAATGVEHIGQSGTVRNDEDGRNLFIFDAKTKL